VGKEKSFLILFLSLQICVNLLALFAPFNFYRACPVGMEYRTGVEFINHSTGLQTI